MFWSLDHCLGKFIYNNEVHHEWVCIYSSILEIVIPEALKFELVDDSSQKSRLAHCGDEYCYNEDDEDCQRSIRSNVPSVCPAFKLKE